MCFEFIEIKLKENNNETNRNVAQNQSNIDCGIAFYCAYIHTLTTAD